VDRKFRHAGSLIKMDWVLRGNLRTAHLTNARGVFLALLAVSSKPNTSTFSFILIKDIATDSITSPLTTRT